MLKRIEIEMLKRIETAAAMTKKSCGPQIWPIPNKERPIRPTLTKGPGPFVYIFLTREYLYAV